jgi:hypothetical protein
VISSDRCVVFGYVPLYRGKGVCPASLENLVFRDNFISTQ